MKIHVYVYTFVYSFSILLVHALITKGAFFLASEFETLELIKGNQNPFFQFTLSLIKVLNQNHE